MDEQEIKIIHYTATCSTCDNECMWGKCETDKDGNKICPICGFPTVKKK